MAMKVEIIGDVHGLIRNLTLQVNNNDLDVDAFIQVGDLGVFRETDLKDFQLKESTSHPQVFFIDGNHDNYNLIHHLSSHYSLPVGLNYIDRGSYLFDHFACLGGGYSIDKRYRTQGVDWWPEEIPKKIHVDAFYDIVSTKAQVAITHEAPARVVSDLGIGEFEVKSPLAHDLDRMLDLGVVVDKWFFGHHHRFARGVVDGVEFICCPDIAEPNQPRVVYDTESGDTDVLYDLPLRCL